MIGSKKMLLHFFSLINYSLLEFIASTSIINFTYTVNTVYFLKQWLFFFIHIKQLILLSKRKSKENCLEDCQWSKVDKCIGQYMYILCNVLLSYCYVLSVRYTEIHLQKYMVMLKLFCVTYHSTTQKYCRLPQNLNF